jgi:glycosyltransferase involved in cell wall biosynthesis
MIVHNINKDAFLKSKGSDLIWQMISGDYPPSGGGVSDYTRIVSEGLVEAGDEVHVWTRGESIEVDQPKAGLHVHRCAGYFDRNGLKILDQKLSHFPHTRRLLVQYVPHAFGYKAMNLLFSRWLRSRAIQHADKLWVMMHEVAYPWSKKSLKHNFLAWMTERMVRQFTGPAERIFMSTSAWQPTLERLGANPKKLFQLPIMSNIPEATDEDAIAKVRSQIRGQATVVVGHFGTFGRIISAQLEPMVLALFRAGFDGRMHLIGGGSEQFRELLVAQNSQLSSKIAASGRLSESEVAHHIRACDIMLQPYGDGPTTRRGSLMACLVNRCPVVSTYGHLCESFWEREKILHLVNKDQPAQAASEILALLANPESRAIMAGRAYDYYSRHFSTEHSISTLRNGLVS